MKRIIKIGFPVVCIAVIGGTFILLNKTTDKINRNKLKDTSLSEANSAFDISEEQEYETESNTLSPEEAKVQEVKNKGKAIELVKKIAPVISNSYYTNEGTENGRYLVSIRDNDSKEVKIYYSVDVQNENIEIYEK